MRTFRDLFDLSGRVALVTGGAGHIGSAMAGALAELGADILLVDRDEDRCRLAAEPVWKVHRSKCHWEVVDLATLTPEAIDRILCTLWVDFHGLDILVNCAAMTDAPSGFDVPFAEQSLSAWDACMSINLRAAFALTQACAPALAASGHGSVINVASIYGMVGPDLRLYEGAGMGNAAAYAASKAGLLGLTRWLATVLAPDVRVNAITAGGVLRDQDRAFIDRYETRTPLRRMATEEDFIGAVAFLASDASAYVTGHNLVIDGGWVAW